LAAALAFAATGGGAQYEVVRAGWL
jgi:hypothetical protein